MTPKVDPDGMALLEKSGWSDLGTDICWLSCDRLGMRQIVGGWEIVLCSGHAKELQTSADSACGYASALPPMGYRGRVWWPWELIDKTLDQPGLMDPRTF